MAGQALRRLPGRQVGAIGQELTDHSSILNGPVICLAGIGVLEYPSCAGSLPSAKFIPWYLLSIDDMSIRRVYRQPVLTRLVGRLDVDDPRITDPESVIAGMEGDHSYE